MAELDDTPPANDPPEIVTPPAPEPTPKKRGPGRPPKDSTKPTAEKIPSESAGVKTRKKTTYDVGLLSKQLMGLHIMAAGLTGIPEVQIAPQEADMLASGVIAVAEQYDLSIDGKTGAAIQLLAAAAMVYAPRVIALQRRIKEAKANNVTDITPKPTAD